MKVIKYLLLVTVVVFLIIYVDFQLNKMYSTTGSFFFESVKIKIFETFEKVLK